MAKELDNLENEEMNIFDEKVKEKEDSSSNKKKIHHLIKP